MIMCFTTIYEYNGWLFEYKPHTGAWPVKKDHEPRKRAGDKFFKMFSDFLDLSDDERKTHKIAGGCL